MNAVTQASLGLPDTQSLADRRGLAIDGAGIRGLRLPALVTDVSGRSVPTVLTAQATVTVSATQKGTHMSRFVDLLQELAADLELAELHRALPKLMALLEADGGRIELSFPWFLQKRAPVSGVASLLDVQARLELVQRPGEAPLLRQTLCVPATSLCPCSKAISEYGAHNQRSEITVTVELTAPLGLDRLAALLEAQASCEVYGLLKRADEKYVTERAYENPKFVEDMVRDVYLAVTALPQVRRATVVCENFESIHNHSAYALIDGAGLYQR